MKKECLLRRTIAVDIENFCGKSRLNSEDVKWARNVIDSIVSIGPRDAVIIGTSSSQNFLAAAEGWAGAAVRAFKCGHNGADLALIDKLRSLSLDKISEIDFFGGDGIFSAQLASMAKAGITVRVFALYGTLSSKLNREAQINPNMNISLIAA